MNRNLETKYYIILIIQFASFDKMQALFENTFNGSIYQEQTEKLFSTCFPNPNSQKLLSVLSEQKIVIQKLLENQGVLKVRFQGLLRLQTTDAEHSPCESDSQNEIYYTGGVQNYYRKINNILVQQRKHSLVSQKRASKKGIQIVCRCPSLQNQAREELLQTSQKKQQQKLPEQTKKRSQTKNIIKNYGKSILTFIRKNRELTHKILEQCQIDESQFYQELSTLKDKVNSITQLKVFWTQNGNRFARLFRIISNLYLKKFSLQHTFSSRVRNYNVHIKYRKRLLDILRNPEDFSSIKYL